MTQIREAKKGDLDDIVSLEISSLGPIWTEDDVEYDEGCVRAFIEEAFDQERMVVFDDDGDILGFLHSRSFEDVVTGKLIREILTLTINPAHFGEGIGGKLIEYEREDAAQKGVDVVKLEVLSSNERAMQFYQKEGFSEKKKVMIMEPDKKDKNLKKEDDDS